MVTLAVGEQASEHHKIWLGCYSPRPKKTLYDRLESVDFILNGKSPQYKADVWGGVESVFWCCCYIM